MNGGGTSLHLWRPPNLPVHSAIQLDESLLFSFVASILRSGLFKKGTRQFTPDGWAAR